jgi:hypothetical protein
MRKMSSVKDQTRPKPNGRHETHDLKNEKDTNNLSKKFSSINLNDQYESNAQKSNQKNGMQMEIKPDLHPEIFHKPNHRKDSTSSLNPIETEPKQHLNSEEKDTLPSLEQLSTKQRENMKDSKWNPILRIDNSNMSRPEIRNYLRNCSCPSEENYKVGSDFQYLFTFAEYEDANKAIGQIQNDLMHHDPGMRAAIYIPVPLTISQHPVTILVPEHAGGVASQEKVSISSALPLRLTTQQAPTNPINPQQAKVIPEHAIFVRNIQQSNYDAFMQYLSHHSGPISRSIFTSSRTTIVEFEDAAAVPKARQLLLKGKYAKISITEYHDQHRSSALAPRSAPQNGQGGMDEIQVGAHLTSPVNAISSDIIRRDWTLTRKRQYVFGTASLDRSLESQGLQCLDNPGGGNCAWHAILDSGRLHSRFKNVSAIRNFVHEYAVNHPEEVDNVARFLQIPSANLSE